MGSTGPLRADEIRSIQRSETKISAEKQIEPRHPAFGAGASVNPGRAKLGANPVDPDSAPSPLLGKEVDGRRVDDATKVLHVLQFGEHPPFNKVGKSGKRFN